MDSPSSTLITPVQVSQMLSVKVTTVYSWVSKGHIPFIKLGHLVRFDPKDILNWVHKQKRSVQSGRSYKVDLPTNGHDL